MKYPSRFTVFPLMAAIVLSCVCGGAAQSVNKPLQVRDRITAQVEDSDVAVLPNSQHPRARVLPDLGPVAADTELERVTMVFKLSTAQQADLDTLLQQQQDPRSPNYHKWLTPAQYHQRFGISDSDLATVKQWLQSNGLVVNGESTNNSMVVFSGNAAQVGRTFHTEIHRYQGAGQTYYANSTDVAIPAALSNIVLGVRALNDFRPHPRPHIKREFTSSISGNHFLTPDDFATIYNLKPLFNAGITGAGQKIAVVGQSDITVTDIRTFRSLSGLPASDPQVILVPGSTDPGVQKGDVDESSLDIEWAGATAPGATILFVNSKNAFTSMQYAIQSNLAPVISVSYGDCELNFSTSEFNTFNALFQQANLQGQTVVSASGDSGAADCDYPTGSTPVTSATHGLSVDFPPSSPNVTGIGGSALSSSATFWSQGNDSNNGSALSYMPETAWNDTASEISNGGSLSASGGGASTQFPKPAWQTGAGVPADGQRDVPDVTFSASADSEGYLICSQGSCVNGYRDAQNNLDVVGGTSAGTPSFAGVVALLNQKMGTSQGNINPSLYALAATSTDAFHDITAGDNKVPCTTGTTNCPTGTTSIGFSAGPGYDQVTGLGSINVTNLVFELSGATPPAPVADFQLGVFQTNAANSDITFTRGATATPDTITVSALNGFSGTVALTCSVSSTLTNTTCSVSPASVNGSGNATLTVKASPLASLRGFPEHEMPHAPLWTSSVFGLCALLFVTKSKVAGKAKNKALISLLMIAMVAVIGVGCGGGGSSASTAIVTPPPPPPPPVQNQKVTGTVTVQATSGSLSHSVQVNVTVN